MTTEPAETPTFPAVTPPDGSARAATLELGKARGLGKLGELGAWVASCQGQFPPRVLRRPRVVVFAADHGVAERGVSVRPAGTTSAMSAALTTESVTALFAGEAGAGLRVVDVGLATDTGADRGSHVRGASGSIDVEDAMTAAETAAAVRAGMAVADAEVDAGADILVVAGLGVGGTTPAATLVAALTGSEPVAVIGRGSGIDDATWMRKATAVRDALRRARPVLSDPLDLLRTAGGTDLAALAGLLAQAAVRRTPVILDGIAAEAAGLVAEELAPGAREWWRAAQATPGEPGSALAREQLDLATVLDLALATDPAAAGAAALPLVVTATKAFAPTP